ncbi:MAG: 2,3-bisphosphoglycerate-independent phosphoglycerate mutase [Pseudomonadota bacterium]
MHTPKPIVLLILDGWGYREEKTANAILSAQTPTFNNLWEKCPHTLLQASGRAVGLPEEQMGNSEVGHLNIGAGRVVYQDLTRITKSIEDGDFFKHPILLHTMEQAKQTDKAIHVFGLLSPGGIHSHNTHIYALIKLAAQQGFKKIFVHAFLDGRDTPPKSALEYIQSLEKVMSDYNTGKIASIVGRYYAMDRDKRWNRVEVAYDLLTLGKAVYTADTPTAGLQLAYDADETDEFVQPISIHAKNESPITIQDGDSIIFMNFRTDRTREITRAFIEPDFKEFPRKKFIQLAAYITLTQYDETFHLPVLYPPENLKNTLGEYLATHHKKQLRLAETEKYAHVTFFMNGGVEQPNELEDRILIPSPKVATYDLQPEMSAREITEKLTTAIRNQKYDFILCNYANPDMVGHTGNMQATIKAIECVDECLSQVITALKTVDGEIIITADHGNAELMFDPSTQQPHTAHTCSPVPFIYYGRPATITNGPFALCDIAPTLLSLMSLPIPKEMTGKSIVKLEDVK